MSPGFRTTALSGTRMAAWGKTYLGCFDLPEGHPLPAASAHTALWLRVIADRRRQELRSQVPLGHRAQHVLLVGVGLHGPAQGLVGLQTFPLDTERNMFFW